MTSKIVIALVPFVVASFLAACAGADSKDTAAGTTPTVPCRADFITGDGVGPVRIGMHIDTIRTICPVTEDTSILYEDGTDSRVASIVVQADAAPDTLYADIEYNKIERILVRSQGLYTSDSVSVGMSVVGFASLSGVHPEVRSGYVYVTTPLHCGMRFRLSVPPEPAPPGGWTPDAIKSLPIAEHVTRILITGCTRRPEPS